MIIFICSPFNSYHNGDKIITIEDNANRVKEYMRWVAELGHTPFAPHAIFPQFLSEETDRTRGILMGLEVLQVCDEVFVFTQDNFTYPISEGMKIEITVAKKLKKPIKIVDPERRVTQRLFYQFSDYSESFTPDPYSAINPKTATTEDLLVFKLSSERLINKHLKEEEIISKSADVNAELSARGF